jgi:hypothetical protein
VDPTISGCPYSNSAEILYLTPPNAIESHMGTIRGIVETMAHETNHMIFMNTRYLQHDEVGDLENMYLLEGIAALAQDLSGFQAGNLFVADHGQDYIDELSLADILVDDGRYDYDSDGTYRGGAYLFMRYLYDQAGGDVVSADGTFEDGGGIAWMQAFHNSPTPGLAGLEAELDRPLAEMMFDFYTALAVTNRGEDGAPISDDPRWNYLPTQVDPLTDRQRGHNAYATLPRGDLMTGPVTAPLAGVDGRLFATGAEYVAIDATEAGPMTVRVTPGDLELQARLARIE